MVLQATLQESFFAANGWKAEVFQDLGSGLNDIKRGSRLDCDLSAALNLLGLYHPDQKETAARSTGNNAFGEKVRTRDFRQTSLKQEPDRDLGLS